MFNINEILLNSKIVDNKLYLPDIQLARNDYLKLSKELSPSSIQPKSPT